MEKKPYSVRLDPELLDKVKEYADQEGETVTAIFEQALNSFLSAPNSKADISTAPDVIADLRHRIKRLETLIEDDTETDPETLNPFTGGDLATIEQLSVITGYSESTLSSKLSKAKIRAVDRIDGNREGIYDIREVLEKVGKKGS